MNITTLPINIEQIDYAELPKLQKLSIETFNDSFRHFKASKDFSNYTFKNYNYGQLAQEMLNPNSKFYFVYYNHKLAGYLKLNFTAEALEIDRFYLRKGFEYIGLETKLLQFTLHKAKKLKQHLIWSRVWEHDDSVLHFYKQFGFQKASSVPFKLNGLLQKDLIMKLKL
jgi:Acetyltransferases